MISDCGYANLSHVDDDDENERIRSGSLLRGAELNPWFVRRRELFESLSMNVERCCEEIKIVFLSVEQLEVQLRSE
jgi:hypothetical protein